MADFTITVDGTAYTSREDAVDAVNAAWHAYKAANGDERVGGDRADYIEWKNENRPSDDEWDGATPEEKAATAEVREANYRAALESREAVAAE